LADRVAPICHSLHIRTFAIVNSAKTGEFSAGFTKPGTKPRRLTGDGLFALGSDGFMGVGYFGSPGYGNGGLWVSPR
jgi:hypothetical protein